MQSLLDILLERATPTSGLDSHSLPTVEPWQERLFVVIVHVAVLAVLGSFALPNQDRTLIRIALALAA